MSPRGGKREGAGRPWTTGEKFKTISAYVSAEQKEKAKRIGEGDMSEGIRRALDAYQESAEETER